MNGETNLQQLIIAMRPVLNNGTYVFCSLPHDHTVNLTDAVCTFREQEGITVILERTHADSLHLSYTFIAAWITLTVHSSLSAVGLTAAFSGALAHEGISCNVVAAFYHDHIFVAEEDAEKAMAVLQKMTHIDRFEE